MKDEFKCGCGSAHGDYCANCGRWTAPTLDRQQHTELSAWDARCNSGKVIHYHSTKEQADRLTAYVTKLKRGK